MKRLVSVFESAGMTMVRSYINSGNVIFETDTVSINQLTSILEEVIATECGFSVKVLLRDIEAMEAVCSALPETWSNDSIMKCDVMYLWNDFDTPETLNQLQIRPGVDQVRYVNGAIVWCVARANISKSGMTKLVGTSVYKNMTIRNCNTTRKLYELMRAKL